MRAVSVAEITTQLRLHVHERRDRNELLRPGSHPFVGVLPAAAQIGGKSSGGAATFGPQGARNGALFGVALGSGATTLGGKDKERSSPKTPDC